jgi:hypothetical protein
MAKKILITPEEQARYDETTRLLEERLAEHRRRSELEADVRAVLAAHPMRRFRFLGYEVAIRRVRS